jgi:hypothetical protein
MSLISQLPTYAENQAAAKAAKAAAAAKPTSTTTATDTDTETAAQKAATIAATTPFQLYPASQAGAGAFGEVPGDVGVPQVASDLQAQMPGVPAMNSAASSDILSNLNGTLSPGTQNALQNASATYGVTSGMPGSDLTWNSLYGNIANASTTQQQTGLSEYNSTIPTVSGTQTVSPDLQTQIAEQNAVDNASPNPTEAGVISTAESLIGSC